MNATQETSNVQSERLIDRVVFVKLDTGRPGVRRKLDSSKIRVEGGDEETSGLVHAAKDIIESKELEAVNKFDTSCRNWIQSKCVGNFFAKGIYMLPSVSVSEVNERINTMKIERQVLIDDFIRAYPELKKKAKSQLGSLYDEADYPTEAKLRSSFRFEHSFVSFDAPEKLKSISSALYEEESEKLRAKMAEAQESVITLLRAEFSQLVDHLVDKLTPGPDGKKKRFFSSNVDNLAEFLDSFSARNITNDEELSALVDKTKSLLKGVDVESIRASDRTRDRTKQAFSKLKSELAPLIEDAPIRQINLE